MVAKTLAAYTLTCRAHLFVTIHHAVEERSAHRSALRCPQVYVENQQHDQIVHVLYIRTDVGIYHYTVSRHGRERYRFPQSSRKHFLHLTSTPRLLPNRVRFSPRSGASQISNPTIIAKRDCMNTTTTVIEPEKETLHHASQSENIRPAAHPANPQLAISASPLPGSPQAASQRPRFHTHTNLRSLR